MHLGAVKSNMVLHAIVVIGGDLNEFIPTSTHTHMSDSFRMMSSPNAWTTQPQPQRSHAFTIAEKQCEIQRLKKRDWVRNTHNKGIATGKKGIATSSKKLLVANSVFPFGAPVSRVRSRALNASDRMRIHGIRPTTSSIRKCLLKSFREVNPCR